MNPSELLEQLEMFRAKYDLLLVDKGYAPARAALDAAIENDPDLSSLQGQIVTLENELRTIILDLQESVKGSLLSVIYQPPRISWDTRRLDILAEEYPAVAACRQLGKPSAQIRLRANSKKEQGDA